MSPEGAKKREGMTIGDAAKGRKRGAEGADK